MDIKNVRKWCREFNKGQINVHDEQRSGRPSLTESTVARIDEMVRANQRITLEEIEDGLNEDCSHFSVHKIVSETLGYRKVSARWVDKWLKEAAGKWYNTGITKLVDRMKKVIEHQGDYVENSKVSNLSNDNSESSDGSSIQVINRKCGSRKRLWVSSDSSDCSSKNIATNTSIGRKRSCNPDNWARNIQKQKRTKGLAYRNRGGYSIPAKTFVDIICRCRQKCNQKILSYDREAAMKTFYSLDSQLAQNIFLRGCIRAKEIKRRRPSNNTKEPRSHSFTYYFRKDKHDIPVCKKYFRDTYQVSDGRIYKCSSKEQVTSLFDQRKGRAASNKIDDTHVVKHIKSFPAYTSHYTRAHNPRRQYLNPDLNIKKMYELYATQCKKENVVPVKEKYYYKVFSTKFNLHFKQPSKDTCQTCDYLQIKIQSSDSEGIQMAKIEKENHLEEAERARSLMAADRKAASDKIFVFSFDLEKALAFPKLTTSVAYYKRNLYVYNFGCHDFNENIGHMFVWPETEGSLNWLKMRWIKLERSKSHIIQFKYDHNENSEFYAIDIRKFVAGRPQSLKNIDQPLLYPKGRTVTSEKRRDMMALLKFIPPVKQSYFKNLRTNRNDESLHTADEEDIIYVADELITNNIIL
ncbi:hypothetical protein LAZ67_13000591 [Cordylochernes scorpioides]|uniref:Uncharacterized protein n=1 Tax=Cordylochernes scorpioides TaxID=51811 RepID=A0ABY6L336_9ARAC|nr:hypothetical protein LAZ67_13000591 [Cordylochernes scorpioides]